MNMDTKDFFKIVETKKKTSKILAECKKLFGVWSYCDDAKLDKDFPPPKKITKKIERCGYCGVYMVNGVEVNYLTLTAEEQNNYTLGYCSNAMAEHYEQNPEQ